MGYFSRQNMIWWFFGLWLPEPLHSSFSCPLIAQHPVKSAWPLPCKPVQWLPTAHLSPYHPSPSSSPLFCPWGLLVPSKAHISLHRGPQQAVSSVRTPHNALPEKAVPSFQVPDEVSLLQCLLLGPCRYVCLRAMTGAVTGLLWAVSLTPLLAFAPFSILLWATEGCSLGCTSAGSLL